MSQIDQIQNFYRLASLCGASEALVAAKNIGLFQAMEGPPLTLEELSHACKIAPHRLELLLDVLVTMGALERYGDDYALSTAMRLANSHPNGLHVEHWRSLPQFMKNEISGEQDHEANHHAFRGDSMSAQWTLTAVAMELAEQLKIGEERRGVQILDLGAGSAMWSCAMAYRDAETYVTAMDLPHASEIALRTAREIGIEPRMEFVPGDYRVAELPSASFDMVLAVELIQLQPLEKCRIWLEQVHQSLVPGGELVLVGRFPGLPRGDLHRTLAALELAMRVPDARQHDPSAIQQLLDSMGFESEAPRMLDAPPHAMGALVARRK